MTDGDLIITNPDLEYNACIALLQEKGWHVDFKSFSWRATKKNDKGHTCVIAWSPIELLGGVTLYEVRGENYRTQKNERKLAENMVDSCAIKIVRRSKFKVIRPLPWWCFVCKKRTMDTLRAIKVDYADTLQLTACCSCGNSVMCGDADGDFEVLSHEGDFYILRYCESKQDPLLDEDSVEGQLA